MALRTYDYTTGIATVMQDGNLRRPQAGAANQSILIIGTAGDGEIGEPVAITSVADAIATFGNPKDGDLVRGIIEAWNGTVTGRRDIRGMRLPGGQAAAVAIAEKAGAADWQAVTSGTYALRLVARRPGEVYNNFVIRRGTVGNRTAIVIENPKTGKPSAFTFDFVNLGNPNVDVHTVGELADAINTDANLAGDIEASYDLIDANYGARIASLGGSSAPESGVTVGATTNLTEFDLTVRWPAVKIAVNAGTFTDFAMAPPDGSTKAWNVSALDKIVSLDRVYEVASYRNLLLEGRAKSYSLPRIPRNVHGDALADLEAVGTWESGAEGTAEFRAHVVDYASDTIVKSDSTTWTATFSKIFAPPDIGFIAAEATLTPAHAWMIDVTNGAAAGLPENYTMPFAAANSPAFFAGTKTHPRYKFKIKLRRVNPLDGTQTDYTLIDCANIVVSGASANYDTASYDWSSAADEKYDPASWLGNYGHAAHTLTVLLSTDSNDANYVSGVPGGVNPDTDILLISFDSIRGKLTEVDEATLAENETYHVPTSYAIRGNRIEFGDTLPYGFEVGFRYFEEYAPWDGASGDVEVRGTKNQVLRWIHATKQPGTSTNRVREALSMNSQGTGKDANGNAMSLYAGIEIDALTDKVWEADAREEETPENAGYYLVSAVPWNTGAKIEAAAGTKTPATIGLKYSAAPEPFDTTVIYRLSGGTNGAFGTSAAEHTKRKAALVEVASALDNYAVDYIVPMSAFIDAPAYDIDGVTVVPALYYDVFADLLATLHGNYADTQIVLGVKPPTNDTLNAQKKYFDDLTVVDPARGATTAANVYQVLFLTGVDDNLKPFFKITAGGAMFYNAASPRQYIASLSAAYAGFLASSPLKNPPTNRPLPGTLGPVFDYRGEQLNTLGRCRYVVVRRGDVREGMLNIGITGARLDSDYSSEHRLRVAVATTGRARRILQRYLGKVSSAKELETMRTELTDMLENVRGEDGISAYELGFNDDNLVNGVLGVELKLAVTNEIRRITISMTMLESSITFER